MSLAVLAIAACSKEDAITEGGKSQQLNVLTSIQTRSAIDGTVMPVGSAIGVHLTATDGTSEFTGVSKAVTGDQYYENAENVRFINEAAENVWASKDETGKNKMLMMSGADQAKVFAYYPYTETVTGRGTTATVPVSIQTEGEIEIPEDLQQNDGASAADGVDLWPAVTSDDEIDYLYHETDANYLSAQTTTTARLNMKHALSRISLRVYASANAKQAVEGDESSYYTLTGYSIKNKNEGTELHTVFDGATLNIADGTISGTESGGQITRTVTGYKLDKASDEGAETATAQAAKRVSNLVFPLASIEADTDGKSSKNIELVLQISRVGNDGRAVGSTNYYIPFDVTTVKAWSAGMNYTYTIKFTGSSLSIETVSVKPWTETVGGNMEIE